MSRDALQQRLAVYAAAAGRTCPTLTSKNVTPHVLRHYVDGRVMWPAGVFPLAEALRVPVPAT
jgi:hypothetical protein